MYRCPIAGSLYYVVLRPNIEKNACNTARDVQIVDALGLKPNGRSLPGSVNDILLCFFSCIPLNTRGLLLRRGPLKLCSALLPHYEKIFKTLRQPRKKPKRAPR